MAMKYLEGFMQSGNRRRYVFFIVMLIFSLTKYHNGLNGAEVNDYLDSLNQGAAVILEADITLDNDVLNHIIQESTLEVKEEKEQMLVMANVQQSMNIRIEPDEDAKKIGILYKDCGGKILQQKDGWTKIESGELIGWAKDEYLLFNEEAEQLASEVGNLVATVDTETLRVRSNQSEHSEVYGLLAVNDEVIALDDLGEWIEVDFDGKSGYVKSEYVKVDFKIDSGETMKTIEERERLIAEEKAAAKAKAEKEKRNQNRGAVAADVTDAQLLSALIQCEAGGENYEGQLAVGAVVVNRLRSGAYPSTMQGVIYASGQFTPALNGKVDSVALKGTKASCQQAAIDALNGVSNIGSATHFKRVGKHDGYVVGNHVFW